MLLKNKLFSIFQLSFMFCNSILSILAGTSESRLYNVASYKVIYLEPSLTKLTIELAGTMYIEAVDNQSKYVMGIPTFYSNLVLGNKEIDLSKCESYDTLGKSFKNPFVVSYNANGLVKQVLISKDDHELTANIKLMFAYYMQNQNTTLFPQDQIAFTVDTVEPTGYGSCSVNYDVFRYGLSQESEEIFVEKSYESFKKCLQKNNRDIYMSDKEYFSSHCAPTSEEDYKWNTKFNMEIERSPTLSVLHSFNITEKMSYKPFKNDASVVKLDHTIQSYIKVTPQDYEVLDVDLSNYMDVKEFKLSHINKSILEDTDSNNEIEVQQLKEIYKALSCSSVDHNAYMQIVEAAILCKTKGKIF